MAAGTKELRAESLDFVGSIVRHYTLVAISQQFKARNGSASKEAQKSNQQADSSTIPSTDADMPTVDGESSHLLHSLPMFSKSDHLLSVLFFFTVNE